jgi:hypothetical protein
MKAKRAMLLDKSIPTFTTATTRVPRAAGLPPTRYGGIGERG